MIYFDVDQFYRIIKKRQHNYHGLGYKISGIQLSEKLGWSTQRLYYVKKRKSVGKASIKLANAVGMSVYEAQSCFKDDGKSVPSPRDGKN